MTEEQELLRATLVEQQQQLSELEVKLSSLEKIQEERDKTHAMVSRMRYNLNLPPLGADFPDFSETTGPTDSPVLRKTLAVLEAKLAALDKQLADLHGARIKRDNIRALIYLMSTSMPEDDEPVPINIEVSDSLTLTDAVAVSSVPPLWVMARQIILTGRTPLNLTTITEALRGLGYPKVSTETVRSAISRKLDVFERRGEGYVVISEDVRPEDRG